MNLGRLCQIILKSDKETSGYGQLAQHAISHITWYGKLPSLHFPRFASLIELLVYRALKNEKIMQPLSELDDQCNYSSWHISYVDANGEKQPSERERSKTHEN